MLGSAPPTASSWPAPTSRRGRPAEGRHRFLPRIPERPLGSLGLRGPPPRPGVRPVQLRFPEPRRDDKEPGLQPLQWLTEHELADLEAALAYVQSRPDADPAGVGLFGVSRGGGAALCVGGKRPESLGRRDRRRLPDPGDDARLHPPLGRDLRRADRYFWKALPMAVFECLAWSSRKRVQRRLGAGTRTSSEARPGSPRAPG